jgi:hypothetical protein
MTKLPDGENKSENARQPARHVIDDPERRAFAALQHASCSLSKIHLGFLPQLQFQEHKRDRLGLAPLRLFQARWQGKTMNRGSTDCFQLAQVTSAGSNNS